MSVVADVVDDFIPWQDAIEELCGRFGLDEREAEDRIRSAILAGEVEARLFGNGRGRHLWCLGPKKEEVM